MSPMTAPERQAVERAATEQTFRTSDGVELFYRSYKQTLDQRKLRSRSPRAARWELHWGLTALLLLGLMSVARIVERGRDPLSLSVAQALRVFSETLRTKRRQRAEEAAAKTGVKMVFPLVFCIFPAIWVVTIGPAAIKFVTVLFPIIENQR